MDPDNGKVLPPIIRNLYDRGSLTMLSIEPASLHCGYEKLATICVWTSIGHGKVSGPEVFKGEILVCAMAVVAL